MKHRFFLAIGLPVALAVLTFGSSLSIHGAKALAATRAAQGIPSIGPGEIIRGPDGNLWFSEEVANAIARLTPRGKVTAFPLHTPQSSAQGMAVGADGDIWFTELMHDAIGRMTPQGAIATFPLPRANIQPTDITTAGDGSVWFAEYNFS